MTLPLAVLLPILVFAAVQAVSAARQERRGFEQVTQARVKQIIEEVDRQLYGELKVLQVLSFSELLQTGEIDRFYEQAQRVVATEPNISHILLTAPGSTRPLFNTLRPFGTALPVLNDQAMMAETLRTKRPVISGIVPQGSVTGEPLVSVWIPVFRDDQVIYVLAAIFDARALARILLADDVPISWVGALVDRKGLVIARTRGPDTLIGAPAGRAVRTAIASGRLDGIYSGVTRDGVDAITPYYTSRLSGWSVHFAIPRDEIEQPLFHSRLITFGSGILSVLVALALAWLVVRDIAQRRRAEQALEQAQRLEIVGRMTGGMAHDFNNLLTVILGNLDTAARRVGADERTARALAGALGAAERGSRLIQQLLAFSRQQALHPQTISVNRLIRQMAPLIKQATGSQITRDYRLGAAPDWCHADPAQLESALLNLAINARDAMPAGGRLAIETRTVGAAQQPQQVEILVTDSGTGMTAEVRDRAFQPFFTTKDPGRGTGLGLSQVYGFIQQSGGAVEIDSKPGAGTTIRLRLPAAATVPEPLDRPIEDAIRPTVASKQVLLVDDQADVRETIAASLIEQGYGITEAADGQAALEHLLGEGIIDLLLTDIAMPGRFNGIELAREAQRLRPDIKILLISGYSQKPPGTASAELDFPFLAKPFRQAELLGRLASFWPDPAREPA